MFDSILGVPDISLSFETRAPSFAAAALDAKARRLVEPTGTVEVLPCFVVDTALTVFPVDCRFCLTAEDEFEFEFESDGLLASTDTTLEALDRLGAVRPRDVIGDTLSCSVLDVPIISALAGAA